MDDVPLQKKSRLEDHPTIDACSNSNVESDVKDTVTPSEVSAFRKASDLKPLKQLKNNLDRRTTLKLKPIKSISLDNSSQKDGQSSITFSPLKRNTQTVSKHVHDRKNSGEKSSLGDRGNASPGDPVGVKDVANVVVKYLSPYLKQGSIVSKVTDTTQTLIYACGFCVENRERIVSRLEEVVIKNTFLLVWLFIADIYEFLEQSKQNICHSLEKPVCFLEFRDWSKSTGGGVGRNISTCGGLKTHDPPLPFGTKLSDPPLNEG